MDQAVAHQPFDECRADSGGRGCVAWKEIKEIIIDFRREVAKIIDGRAQRTEETVDYVGRSLVHLSSLGQGLHSRRGDARTCFG